MTKILLVLNILLILLTVFSSSVLAQGMINWGSSSATSSSSVSSTSEDEAKGKQIWEQLQSKQTSCNNLNDNDFEFLGEYFMGQVIGNTERHTVMNQMMQNMMGQNGEEQMHIALGKRSSGCDINAPFPSGYGLPMIWIWGGGGNPMAGFGGWGTMMNSWGGFGILGLLTMIVFWFLIILGVVALIRYLGGARPGITGKHRSSLDILEERYAKGEIDKKEFEDKKKDLS